MTGHVPEAVARPARTGAQLTAAAVLVELVAAFGAELDGRQYAALVGALGLLLGFLQTVVENRTGWAFLRHMPPHDVDLVEHDEP